MPGHHHRSGALKQSNKRNKRSRASKRSLGRSAGGRVNAKANSTRSLVAHCKADRRHMMQQRREASRKALLQKRRGLDGVSAPPPRVVGIVSLGESEEELETRLINRLLESADKVVREKDNATVTAKYNTHKKDGTVTYLSNSQSFARHYGDDEDRSVMGALDLCRVCDMVLFVIDGNALRPGEEDDVVGMTIGDDRSVSTVKTSRTQITQDWDHIISERGDRIVAAVKGQGLPTPLTVLAKTQPGEDEELENTNRNDDDFDFMTAKSFKSVRRAALKRGLDLRKYVGRFATTEFGVDHDKVMEIDLVSDDNEDNDDDRDDEDMAKTDNAVMNPVTRAKQAASFALVRAVCTMAASPPKWVAKAPRSYLLADSQAYSEETEEMMLTGHLRGSVPFNVNSLVHVPNMGTFVCKAVRRCEHELMTRKSSYGKKNGGAGSMDMTDNDATDGMGREKTTLFSNPSEREGLEMFADANALDGEQNLVGFDEREEDEWNGDDDNDDKNKTSRPAGWSDYQASWLDAVDDLGDNEDDQDRGELAAQLNQKPGATTDTDDMMMDDDVGFSKEERESLLEQRRKEQTEELEFPDEVEVKMTENARDRFARYRSLKSFRKSYWDAKENLPDTYASIYSFRSFRATQRDVYADMKETIEAATAVKGQFWGKTPGQAGAGSSSSRMMDDDDDDDDDEYDVLEGCIPSGQYVSLLLEGVSPKAYARLASNGVVAAVGLLPHENKATVLNMGLSQSAQCNQLSDVPVKSKDILTFRCGWRTWKARPIFSQHNLNSDKHKFERFLPRSGVFFAASCFGPVTYSPCPVMLFREGTAEENRRELVAIGSMLPADTDRIVVKRIVLTGYPTRVHKRYATVKYMFFNPDDVRWFKPAGIVTKHGLIGNILQSVGEHGTMKCLFNAPIQQHDTVCLPLYKRIYPKFANTTPAKDDGVTVRSVVEKDALVVL